MLVGAVATLSTEELERLETLRATKQQWATDDPTARAKECRGRAARLKAVHDRIVVCLERLTPQRMAALISALEHRDGANAANEAARGGAFADVPLAGVGSATWRTLWNAARDFATRGATPPQSFPPTSVDDALCVLCQQPVSDSAVVRMAQFEAFIQSTTERDLLAATRAVTDAHAELTALAPHGVIDEVGLAELTTMHPYIAAALTDDMAAVGFRRDALVALALSHAATYAAPSATLEINSLPLLIAAIDALTREALEFDALVNVDGRAALERELAALESRILLDTVRTEAHAEIERLRTKERLKACLAQTNTAALTIKNKDVLATAITAPLAAAFDEEMTALRLTHIPVALGATRGERGRSLHALSLARATVPTVEVISEGEHRGVALAAFLAEVAMQSSASTIVFDDPVSSMDHDRRGYVAQRIVSIAATRPVVVFTHDKVFFWLLQQESEAAEAPMAVRTMWRDADGSGLVRANGPWDGLTVSKRIRQLRDECGRFPKMAREAAEQYADAVRGFYGRLRETWERSVEEIIFNGAVQRFGQTVQTQRLEHLHRISEAQMTTFYAAMTRTSAWTIGHDHAAALSLPTPTPAEAQNEITLFDTWVRSVLKTHEGNG